MEKSLAAICIVFAALICGLFAVGAFNVQEHNYAYEYYTFERDLAYIYKEKEAKTNNFGAVTGYNEYMSFGVVNPDDSVTNNREYIAYWYLDSHSLNISDRNYILYTVEKKICTDCNTESESIIDYDFYLTDEMFKNIGAGIN